MAARDDCRPRGAYVIDDENVLAFQGSWTLPGAFRIWLEDRTYILLPLPSVFMSLAFCKGSSSYKMCKDGEIGDVGNALGYLLALVVASLLEAVLGKGDGDDAVDVVEEVDPRAFLSQKSPHVESDFRVMVILELVEDVACEGMALVIKQGSCFLDGDLMPKHLRHLVFIGILPCVGSGKMQVAGRANAFFATRQSVPAYRAETREK